MTTALTRWFIVLLLLASASPVCARDQVWFETPVAEVTVGLDPATGTTIQRAFYLAYVGPQEAIPNPGVARNCAEGVVKPLRDRIRQTVIALDEGKVPDELTARSKYYNKGTAGALLAVTIQIEGKILNCIRAKGAPLLEDVGFFLSLVQRDCVRDVCRLSKTRRRTPGEEDTRVFGALYRWTSSKSAVEQRNATNQHFRLNFQGNDDNYFAVEADFQPICEVNEWLGYVSPDDCRIKVRPLPPLGGDPVARLKALISDVRGQRDARNQVAFEAGLITEIGRPDFLRIADALADAQEGYARADVSRSEVLKGVSNELARLRFTECRYYRGFTGVDDIARCTGFGADAPSLAACLGARLCEPVLPNEAKAIAFLINDPRTLRDLATGSALPRYFPADFAKTLDSYNECSAQTGAGGTQRCFRSKLIGADERLAAIEPCLEGANRLLQTDCAIKAVGGAVPPELACASKVSQRAAAECLMVPTLPPQAQALYKCRNTTTTSAALVTCAAGVAGGDAARIAACRKTNASSDLLFVVCAAGDNVPPELAKGLTCLEHTRAALSDFAACAVTTQLPPEVSAQVGCVLQSQGNLVGAGACIATQRLNLSPDQQLALQCLASTGGEPQSFAICFGGQLTMQEMKQCNGKKFGEGDCFGENNEFQKLAKSLTGDTISSNSVVGQITTVYMQPAVLIFAMAEPVTEVATNVIGGVGNVISRAGDDVKAALRGDASGLLNVAAAPVTATIRLFFPSF